MKLIRSLEYLNQLIKEGYEYPDAEFTVSVKHNLSDKAVIELRKMYDEQGVVK